MHFVLQESTEGGPNGYAGVMIGLNRKLPIRHALIAFMTVVVSGCSVSQQLSDGHLAYNQAVRLASDKEILLNIVRLRYLEPIEFLAITSINSTVSFSASVDLTAGRASGANAVTGEATAGYSNSPTFSFVPQRGTDFSSRLAKPLDLESLIFMASSHRDVHTVFRLFVSWMNGLENQEGFVDSEFVDVTQKLTNLQFAGEALFGFIDQQRVVSPPIPAANLTPAQIIQAHNAGLTIQQKQDSDDLQLTINDRQAMLTIDRTSGACEEVIDGLKLNPQAGQVPIVLQAEFKAGLDAGQLAIRTRSLLHALTFLSQGIDVPPEDAQSGRASSPWPHPSVQPVPMDDLFHVRYSEEEPEDASIAVQFRDHWYYISATDVASRRTFLLISEAFRFSLESNSDDAPTLTFPVGAGAD